MCNLVCTGAGIAFMGELFQRGFQDSGAGLLRLAARAGFSGSEG
jgi:hypothetical protein